MSYSIALFETKKSKKIYVGKMKTKNLLVIAISDEEKKEYENGIKSVFDILHARKEG